MHVTEITVGLERKTSDGNYGSTQQTAYLKASLSPTDNVAAVLVDLDEQLRAFLKLESREPVPTVKGQGHVPDAVYVVVSGTNRDDRETIEVLKENGYSWSPGERSWWVKVSKDQAQVEINRASALNLFSRIVLP